MKLLKLDLDRVERDGGVWQGEHSDIGKEALGEHARQRNLLKNKGLRKEEEMPGEKSLGPEPTHKLMFSKIYSIYLLTYLLFMCVGEGGCLSVYVDGDSHRGQKRKLNPMEVEL